MSKLQQGKGITLIALIVTIVVLLILAGVSIAVITGDDGIIKSANQAKTEQIGGTVEDRVAVWKAGKATSEYTHRETKTEDEMLNDLINDKLLFEDEIVSPTENSFINLIGIYLGYTSIQSIPENLFANCPNVTNFSYLFIQCENLKSIPEKLFANCPNVTSFQGTFVYCSNLTSIPEKLFANCPNVTDFSYSFTLCENLESIPEKLFANCPNVMSFEGTFQSCNSITSIPEKLFDNSKKVESFKRTFCDCSMLTGKAPELWKSGTNSEENEYKGNPNGEDCFAVCGVLENRDEIPDYWKSGIAS